MNQCYDLQSNWIMKQEDQAENELCQYAYRLQEEILFWRHMISKCRKDDHNTELSRMQEAMALAEYRLLQFNEAQEKTQRH